MNWDKLWESIYLVEYDIYPNMYESLKELPEKVWKKYYKEIICQFEQMKTSIDEYHNDCLDGKR